MNAAPLRSPARARSLLTALVAVQAVILMWLAAVVGTSPDEEYTMRTTAHGAAYAFGRALSYELQAPLYFVLCALWRSLEPSLVFARLLSVGCALATTVIVAAIGRRLFGVTGALALAAAFVISPFATYGALDVRPYALALMLCALTLLGFVDGWACAERRSARILFLVAGVLGVYTQYYNAFLILALAAGLAAAGRPRALASYVLWAGAVAVSLLPLARVIPAQVADYDYPQRTVVRALGFVVVTPLHLFAIPPDGMRHLFLSRAGFIALVAVFAVALAAGGIRWAGPRMRLALGTTAGVFAVYAVCATVLHVDFVAPRHFYVFVLPLLIAGGVAVTEMRPERRRLCGGLVALIFALSNATSTAWQYRALTKEGDWRRVAAFVGARVRPGDRVEVFMADSAPALARYLRASAVPHGFPHDLDPRVYRPLALRMDSQADAERALRRDVRAGGRLFLVIDCPHDEKLTYEGCRDVTLAVDHLYPRRGRADFFGSWVAEIPAPAQPVRSTRRILPGRSAGRATRISRSGSREVRAK